MKNRLLNSDEKELFYHIFAVIMWGFFAFLFSYANLFAMNHLWDSLVNLFSSVLYYISEIFGLDLKIVPSVTEVPSVSGGVEVIPDNFGDFKLKFMAYWAFFGQKSSVLGYLGFLANFFFLCVQFVMPIILLFAVVKALVIARFKKPNNNYNQDSLNLRVFKFIVNYTYVPFRDFVKDFVVFLKKDRFYLFLVVFLFCLFFNIFSIVVDFFAFYFYFIVSLDFSAIYNQVYKILLDLSPLFKYVSWWIWLIILVILFDRFRKKIGYMYLDIHERRNREFIDERPIVFMLCGTMGKFKTTTLTDIALSEQIRLRDKALELMYKNDLKFPNFPFINLENELKRAINYGEVYNLATCKLFINKKIYRFDKKFKLGFDYAFLKNYLFDYDFKNYGLVYDDCLGGKSLFEVLENYAQLYFIYLVGSTIISNYSIRSDCDFCDSGNFPVWNNDFFRRKCERAGVYSHILDFDSLRLGKKVLENNVNANSFEFGVVSITEIGKERKNTLELNGKKKDEDNANQKNDLFNSWLKMVRHSATVDNFPFVSVITDEQRPESWGADARDLCEIITVRKAHSVKLTMPFFFLGELICGSAMDRFNSFYYNYRFNRGDNTLFVHLLKGVVSKLNGYYDRIYNTFGSRKLDVDVELGTQDGERVNSSYYLSTKKIYSRRFSTDCFSDFFTAKSMNSAVGINDLPSYETVKASLDELKLQNSYFIEEWFTCMGKNIENKEKKV